MAIKATINSVPKTRISINKQERSTVRTVALSSDMTKLRDLKDVNASNLVDGHTVVYDGNTDKFVVEELPKVNGGTF